MQSGGVGILSKERLIVGVSWSGGCVYVSAQGWCVVSKVGDGGRWWWCLVSLLLGDSGVCARLPTGEKTCAASAHTLFLSSTHRLTLCTHHLHCIRHHVLLTDSDCKSSSHWHQYLTARNNGTWVESSVVAIWSNATRQNTSTNAQVYLIFSLPLYPCVCHRRANRQTCKRTRVP
jgi:hypothetical protein